MIRAAQSGMASRDVFVGGLLNTAEEIQSSFRSKLLQIRNFKPLQIFSFIFIVRCQQQLLRYFFIQR
uniref:Uncharacterized protein n=1 Tax=Steinernema glaseri TaxID=37863 RepID=A0A1I7YH46_9BILA